jgi:outer membrane protein
MKNLSIALSILSLVLVGVLFYLHFTHQEKINTISKQTTQQDSSEFRIAYFDIDSLQANYEYFKDVSTQIKNKENQMTAELSSLQNTYQKRMRELQQRGPNMSQSEGEAAQREFSQMQQKYEQRQMTMEQELKRHQIEMMTDVRGRIEKFLQDYNKQKGYAFILSYEPGFMLYYKDSLYDITKDVIAGLNAQYKKK